MRNTLYRDLKNANYGLINLRNIFETYRNSEGNGALESVIQKDRTFCEIGSPIIRKIEEIEKIVLNKKWVYVGKKELLGRDVRDPNDEVAETVDYLKRHRIIYPLDLIHPKIIVPLEETEIANARISIFFGGLFMTGVSTVLALTLLPTPLTLAVTPMLAIGESRLTAILATRLDSYQNNPIKRQRRNFEEALKFMDSQISRVYHSDQ